MAFRILLALTMLAGAFAVGSTSLAGDDQHDAGKPLFNADGYRVDRYRSPTPSHLEGAEILDTASLAQALASQAPPLLIDVYNLTWRGDRFVVTQPHASLPGAIWLPNTGLGELSPAWQQYFLHHLTRLTRDERQRMLVFLCRSDCWLSWNAARRALAHGFDHVGWYPHGVDGWEAAGQPLEAAEPAAPISALSGHDGP